LHRSTRTAVLQESDACDRRRDFRAARRVRWTPTIGPLRSVSWLDSQPFRSPDFTRSSCAQLLLLLRLWACGRRPHASLDGMTPNQAYFTPLPFRSAA
jgi:hypothetical protein